MTFDRLSLATKPSDGKLIIRRRNSRRRTVRDIYVNGEIVFSSLRLERVAVRVLRDNPRNAHCKRIRVQIVVGDRPQYYNIIYRAACSGTFKYDIQFITRLSNADARGSPGQVSSCQPIAIL